MICHKPIVLYRKLDGSAVALEDACLHRLLPLSMGRIEGDTLVCGYHGMAFDSTGLCVRIPTSRERPSSGSRVRSYPVVERHGLIWVWLGDAAIADPKSIPDLHWADDPAWASSLSHIELKCDFRLVIDNLMDLTHETFVHASSIGHEKITEVPMKVEHDDKSVTASRWMIDCDGPPFMARQLRLARDLSASHVDRWQVIRFEAPTTIVIDVGLCPTGMGAPEGDRSKGFNGRVLNTVTPQSDGRCDYFFGYARDFCISDANLTAELRAGVIKIFSEDKAILEAQQKSLDLHPDRRLLNLGPDSGSMWARRIIKRMIQAEAGSARIRAGTVKA
jgi:vanillate O-demethylase monooxygenase subunit